MIQMMPEPTKWHWLIDSWRLHSNPSHGAFLTWQMRPDCPRNHDFGAER